TAIGVLALALVAIAPNLLVFFLAWVLAGLAQAGTLYPLAFAVVTRWYGAERTKPLTTITLVGGLASTVFAPILARRVDVPSWRATDAILAGLLGVVLLPLNLGLLNRRWTDETGARDQKPSGAELRRVTRARSFLSAQSAVAIGTLTVFAET